MLSRIFQTLIGEELFASLVYEAIANILLTKGLTDYSKKTRDISREELEHVQELTELAIKNNIVLDYKPDYLQDVKTNSWETNLDAISYAVDLEQIAIDSYKEKIDLIKKSGIKSVPTIVDMLQHILDEEIEHKGIFAEIKIHLIPQDFEAIRHQVSTQTMNGKILTGLTALMNNERQI